MKVKSESEVAQSCLTLHDPMDCSPPGSSVHGIWQARVLEWVAIAFSLLPWWSDFGVEPYQLPGPLVLRISPSKFPEVSPAAPSLVSWNKL